MIPDRYTVENFREALRDPSMLFEEVERVTETCERELRYMPHKTVGRLLFHQEYGHGTDVMDRDWDNLVILDACRYDTFAQHNPIDGTLEDVVSKGSHSDEFIIGNFHGRDLTDTVYISANPHTDKTLETYVFHSVLRSYSEVRWTHREFENYHPEHVSKLALEHYERFSDKRIIVHFMQPHAPYLGSFAAEVRDELAERGIPVTNSPEKVETEPTVRNLLEATRQGYVSDRTLEQCYVENLELVLEEVQRLLDRFEGKSVVTGDHGEMLGDPDRPRFVPKRYGHPRDVYLPETRVVPWLVVEGERRRPIISEESPDAETVSEETVNEQLEALGYVG